MTEYLRELAAALDALRAETALAIDDITDRQAITVDRSGNLCDLTLHIAHLTARLHRRRP